MNRLNYKLGFQDYQPAADPGFTIVGKIPLWLEGTYLYNSSGQFHLPKQTLNHWFDGLSLVNKFQFRSGEVTYQSVLLDTEEARHVAQYGKLKGEEFGTHVERSTWQKIVDLFKRFQLSDNTNINIFPVGKDALTMTETFHINKVDIATLKNVTPLAFDDQLNYKITTVHPVYDSRTHKLINLGVKVGPKSSYQLFEMDLHSFTRELICSIPIQFPAYHHSFACTDQYIVLFECPYRLNPLPFAFAIKGFGAPYIQNYRWDPKHGTKFIVIDRYKKMVVNEIMADPFFVFHTANCYQQGTELIIDAVIFETPHIIQQLYLDKITQGDTLDSSRLARFKLNLATNTCSRDECNQFSCEFPRYNESYQGQKYRYVYSVGWQKGDAFFNSLLKWDMNNETSVCWQQANCYPNEPIFVANPEAKNEDQGLVLSLVLDANKEISFLLLLDAETWTELARVELKHILPFGFHGNFASL